MIIENSLCIFLMTNCLCMFLMTKQNFLSCLSTEWRIKENSKKLKNLYERPIFMANKTKAEEQWGKKLVIDFKDNTKKNRFEADVNKILCNPTEQHSASFISPMTVIGGYIKLEEHLNQCNVNLSIIPGSIQMYSRKSVTLFQGQKNENFCNATVKWDWTEVPIC